MKNLKKRIQLKIQIPKQNKIEESKTNIFSKIENNNRNSISQITDNIFISGYLIGKNCTYLKSCNFTHVINCSLGSSMVNSQNLDEISIKHEYEKYGIKYLAIYLRDDPEADIIYHIFEIIDFIESDKDNKNKKILFHCIEGISRAPSMVAGYLMWKENIYVSNAIELIKSKRDCADINLGFNIQLHKWEKYLFSSPKKIQVFEMSPNIRLVGEEEKDIDINQNYLIKIKYKLYYINNIYNNENELINNMNNKNNNKSIIFNIFKDQKKEFIRNVIKYDKGLLNNDFSSFVEIR
jgi:protein-tyrosine phosphatase